MIIFSYQFQCTREMIATLQAKIVALEKTCKVINLDVYHQQPSQLMYIYQTESDFELSIVRGLVVMCGG